MWRMDLVHKGMDTLSEHLFCVAHAWKLVIARFELNLSAIEIRVAA